MLYMLSKIMRNETFAMNSGISLNYKVTSADFQNMDPVPSLPPPITSEIMDPKERHPAGEVQYMHQASPGLLHAISISYRLNSKHQCEVFPQA